MAMWKCSVSGAVLCTIVGVMPGVDLREPQFFPGVFERAERCFRCEALAPAALHEMEPDFEIRLARCIGPATKISGRILPAQPTTFADLPLRGPSCGRFRRGARWGDCAQVERERFRTDLAKQQEAGTMTAILEASTAQDNDTPATPVFEAPIRHPSAWKVADFKSPADYTIELSAANLRDIEQAIRQIKAAGLGLDDLQREHFELSSLRPVIAEIRHQIEDGRGFVVVRRLPVEDYSKDELGMIFWGLGTHLGRGLSQSVLGDRLGHVKDFSREDPLARAYRNKQELSPHTDSCDLVGLACLRNAQRRGGVSRLTSALTVHNVMLAEHPECLERLYRGYVFHRRGEEQPGELPYTPYRVPVYSNTEGKVSARYVRTYVEAGEAAAGRPMGDGERAVLDRFEEITKRPELMLEFTLQPGRGVFHQQLHDPARAHRVR